MQYISTRGGAPALDFRGAMLAGLAPDGGLYVPASVPQFSATEIASFAKLTYQELALAIISPFVGGSFSAAELKRMIEAAYKTFDHPAVAPMTELAPDHFLLELFHGPTLSFKDFALQLLGQMMEAALRDSKQHAIVLGATSGDTGSAAIAGCSGHKNLDIVILYPEGRTSDVQRKQMTTTGARNVHAVAVKGTFDDCQALVKALFSDAGFRKEKRLLAVNSINWARVMAQIVYYFYAALQLGAPARKVNFCVPTGNFGDIFAGYMAKQMGLPIAKLIIASNSNDILTRCVTTGEYKVTGVHATLSPSMDIQVSSNFERLLFDLYGRDGKKLGALMADFAKNKSFKLSPEAFDALRGQFLAHAVSDEQTLAQIKETASQTGTVLDPHSAVGVASARALRDKIDGPIVTLATAHPAKFPEAVKKATGKNPELPKHLADLFSRKETLPSVANSADAVRDYLRNLK